jgi:ubiquinone/menaquinone biosynthesis C-methylase UbiE
MARHTVDDSNSDENRGYLPDAVIAEVWARWQEPALHPLWRSMLNGGRVAEGTRLLDVGCGIGGAMALAAEYGAEVSGTDPSEAFVSVARKRLPGADIRVGGLDSLPHADGRFDAVLVSNPMRYSLLSVAAVRELGRVCAPGGRIVIAACEAPGGCGQCRILKAIIDALTASPFEVCGACSYASDTLVRLIEQAELVMIHKGEVTSALEHRDLDTGWSGYRSINPSQQSLWRAGEERLQEAVRRAVLDYLTGTGGGAPGDRYRYVAAACGKPAGHSRQGGDR